MFELSEIPKAVEDAVTNLLRLLGAGPAAAVVGSGDHTPDDRTAMRCFKAPRTDRPIETDCAEFYQPDGRLIWEEGANAEV